MRVGRFLDPCPTRSRFRVCGTVICVPDWDEAVKFWELRERGELEDVTQVRKNEEGILVAEGRMETWRGCGYSPRMPRDRLVLVWLV